MTTIAADMTSSTSYVPLSEADALASDEGYYTIGSENLFLGGIHMQSGAPPSSHNRPNGRAAVRGIGGSTAASHSSGATITRYYPEAPSGGGGDTPTLAEVLVAGRSTDDTSPTILGTAHDWVAAATADLSGGNFNVLAGSGIDDGSDEPGGAIDLRAGSSATNPAGGGGGHLVIQGANDDGSGGYITLSGGVAGVGTGTQGGDITLTPGAGDGAGRHGLVFLNLPTSDPGVSGATYAPNAATLISGVTAPVIPLTIPSTQDVIDALIALGLVTQSD